ncbi:hypothetical protein PanWU01x14_268880, partial [Parasponia andersonii]
MDRAPETGVTTFDSNGDGNQLDMSLTTFSTVSNAVDTEVRRAKNLQVPSAGSHITLHRPSGAPNKVRIVDLVSIFKSFVGPTPVNVIVIGPLDPV